VGRYHLQVEAAGSRQPGLVIDAESALAVARNGREDNNSLTGSLPNGVNNHSLDRPDYAGTAESESRPA
jgi:hypothetical protein